MIYASPLRRSFDATVLIIFILLIRRLFDKKLNPACLRLSWSFVALRILIPVQIPVFNSLYTRLHLPGGCEHIENWITNCAVNSLLQIDYANAAGSPINVWLWAKAAFMASKTTFLSTSLMIIAVPV